MNSLRNASPHPARRIGRRLTAAVALLPAGLCALGAAAAGQRAAARRWLGATPHPDLAPDTDPHPHPQPAPPPRAGVVRLVGYAVLTVLLGALALVLAGVVLLALARGALYGFVDPGPYDTSWGGPSKAGAWLTHFAVSLPFAAAAAGLLYALAGLHRRLTEPLRGARRPGWVLPTALVGCLAGALFVFAFVRQLN